MATFSFLSTSDIDEGETSLFFGRIVIVLGITGFGHVILATDRKMMWGFDSSSTLDFFMLDRMPSYHRCFSDDADDDDSLLTILSALLPPLPASSLLSGLAVLANPALRTISAASVTSNTCTVPLELDTASIDASTLNDKENIVHGFVPRWKS